MASSATGAVEGRDNDRNRSIARLVKDVSQQTSRLMHAEARLAIREATAKAKRSAAGGGLLGAAAVFALYGGGALIAGLVALLALVLPVWASALILGGGLVILGALLGLIGAKIVRKSAPPTPDDTINSVKADVNTVKERARR